MVCEHIKSTADVYRLRRVRFDWLCESHVGQAAQANGEEVTLRDGMVVISTNSWKTEDGKNYYNTGIQGEVLGEEVSPWQEIVEVGDMIEFSMVRYARAE